MKKAIAGLVLLLTFSFPIAFASNDTPASGDYLDGYRQGWSDALALMISTTDDQTDLGILLNLLDQRLGPSEAFGFLSIEEHLAIVSDMCSDGEITATEFLAFRKNMPLPQFDFIATLDNPTATAIAKKVYNKCSDIYTFAKELTQIDTTITDETKELFEDHMITLIALRDSLISIAGSDAVSTMNLSAQKLEESAQALKIEADPEAVSRMQETVQQVMDTVKRNSK